MEPDPRLASSRLHADAARLRAQVDLSWPQEFEVLRRLGLRDGMHILDVGSGPGFIAAALLDALPNARVTALELDPEMLSLIRPHPRLSVVPGSVLMTDLPDASVDFTLARLVFQHVAAPEMAAAEMLRLLRPGGRAVVVDVDDALGGILVPRLPEFEQVERKVRHLQAGAAGNREIGRHLWRILADAGFEGLRLDAVLIHSDDVGLEAFVAQYAPDRYRAVLTSEESDAYARAFDRFMASPDAFILQLLLVASGVRPPGAAV